MDQARGGGGSGALDTSRGGATIGTTRAAARGATDAALPAGAAIATGAHAAMAAHVPGAIDCEHGACWPGAGAPDVWCMGASLGMDAIVAASHTQFDAVASTAT